MTSFTNEKELASANGHEVWKQRDEKFGIDSKSKSQKREYIETPELDACKLCTAFLCSNVESDTHYSGRLGVERRSSTQVEC